MRVTLDGVARLLLWHDDFDDDAAVDGLVLDERGRLVTFADLEAVRAHAVAHALELCEGELEPNDLDALATWLAEPGADSVDPSAFLQAWNLFIDLRSSIAGRNTIRDPDGARRIYDKLFWANNIPAVTPPGERFDPEWTAIDVAELKRVLGDGLALFRAAWTP